MNLPSRAFYEGVNPKTIWNNCRRRLAGNCQTCPDRQLPRPAQTCQTCPDRQLPRPARPAQTYQTCPNLPAPATWAGIALLCPSDELFGEFGEKRVGLVWKFEFAHGFECETAVAHNLRLGIGIHSQFAIEGLH